MFGKYVCNNCGKEYKKKSMAKDKSGNYTCVNCRKLLSRYFPGCFKSTTEQISENIALMKKHREIYENVFLRDEELIVIKNENLGIMISEKLGLFKVIDDEWAEYNRESDCELFRFDQINRYEVYEENKKDVFIGGETFVECGVRIYMNSEREPERDRYRPAPNQKKHPYLNRLEVQTASAENLTPSAVMRDKGLGVAYEIVSVLDRIIGGAKEEAGEKRLKMREAADSVM